MEIVFIKFFVKKLHFSFIYVLFLQKVLIFTSFGVKVVVFIEVLVILSVLGKI